MCFLCHHNHSSLLLKLLTPFTLTLRHVFSCHYNPPSWPHELSWNHSHQYDAMFYLRHFKSYQSCLRAVYYGMAMCLVHQYNQPGLKLQDPPPSHSYINMTGLDFLSQLIHAQFKAEVTKALKHYVLVWRVMVDIRTLIPIHYVTKKVFDVSKQFIFSTAYIQAAMTIAIVDIAIRMGLLIGCSVVCCMR